jgi:hypothetical protein
MQHSYVHGLEHLESEYHTKFDLLHTVITVQWLKSP